MLSRRQGVRFALSAALGCAGLAALPGANAWADLDVAYKNKTGLVNEGTQAQATASCPPGMKVSGGGGEAAGIYGGARLNTTYPPSETSWTTYYDSNAGTIQIRSYAVCVDRDPVLRDKGANASGLSANLARARCKGSRRPTGGGVFSGGLFGQTAILQTVPYALPSQRPGGEDIWQVFLYNTSSPYVDGIPFRTWAVCHNLDVSYREGQDILRKGRRGSVTARCRGDEQVLGGGGLAASLDIHVVQSFPLDLARDDDPAPDDAWRVVLDNFDVQREVIAAYASCVEA